MLRYRAKERRVGGVSEADVIRRAIAQAVRHPRPTAGFGAEL
jgi:hypothetical protein